MIVEPVAGNMGVVPPADGYLQALREACDRTGALLILDEVITGFRVARGGAQERYGVRADLTCFGKVIGGGLPVGAFGGRADVMRELAPGGALLPGGHALGEPARHRGRAGRARPSWRAPGRLRAAGGARRGARGGRRRQRPAGDGQPGRLDAHPLLRRGAGARLRRGHPQRHGRLRAPRARRCSRRASTRPRRSSRPGSWASPTTTPRSRAIRDGARPGGGPRGREGGARRRGRPGRRADRPGRRRRSWRPLVTPPLAPDQAIGLDLILEGFLLHHGRPRHVAPAAPGRGVLAGDYCYAHGLVRIAAAGDLFVVSALADLIALGAGIVAAGERAGLVPLWRATTCGDRRPARAPRAPRSRRASGPPRTPCARARGHGPSRSSPPSCRPPPAWRRRWRRERARPPRLDRDPREGGRAGARHAPAVDPHLEITEIADRAIEGRRPGPAVHERDGQQPARADQPVRLRAAHVHGARHGQPRRARRSGSRR